MNKLRFIFKNDKSYCGYLKSHNLNYFFLLQTIVFFNNKYCHSKINFFIKNYLGFRRTNSVFSYKTLFLFFITKFLPERLRLSYFSFIKEFVGLNYTKLYDFFQRNKVGSGNNFSGAGYFQRFKSRALQNMFRPFFGRKSSIAFECNEYKYKKDS